MTNVKAQSSKKAQMTDGANWNFMCHFDFEI
jgi:hypothetical protein